MIANQFLLLLTFTGDFTEHRANAGQPHSFMVTYQGESFVS